MTGKRQGALKGRNAQGPPASAGHPRPVQGHSGPREKGLIDFTMKGPKAEKMS
jgi:hypothetical protein